MGPKPLSNISKMPMKKSSFSSHLIKTVFGKSFILCLKKQTNKQKGWRGEEIFVLYGGNCDERREEKFRASKAQRTEDI